MKRVIDGLFTALSLYSVIPAPRTEWNRGSLRYVLCFFPLVGVVTGVASLLWFELCVRFGVSAALFSAVALLIPLLVSGGIHMDGFIDTADALASHSLRERRLEIMQDSHVGAFGVLFNAGQLLLSFGLWWQVYERPGLVSLAAVGYVVSRAASALLVASMPAARPSGMMQLLRESAGKTALRLSSIAVLAVMLGVWLAISPLWGGIAATVAAAYALLHRRFCVWEFGGNTGDLSGFFLVNLELLLLAVASVGGLAS